MKKTTNPMRPTIKGERTWAEDHGYWIPPHVSPITIDVAEPIMRTFPLKLRVRLAAHEFTSAYMISILLIFSFRVACGVLRRRKSTTRIALKAHIGRLRSVWLVHNTCRATNQIPLTKQPSPRGAQNRFRRVGES